MTATDPTPPRTPADLSAERAILRWAAGRLGGEPAEYSVGHHERGHIADLLRRWAAELDTAPAPVYQLPAEPPPEVTELWDRDGDRWARKQWRYQPGGDPAPRGTSWIWERNGLGERQRWPGLLGYGPLSTTPPADAETVESVTEAAGWIRDERDQAEETLAEVLRLLDRLDESGQDYDTALIRGVVPEGLAARVLSTTPPAGTETRP